MTQTETVSTERPDGHYWVRFGAGHEWEVMLWDGTHFWGTAGDGYRGEDFEVGPQVFPPTSSRGNHPQSPVLQGFEDENGLEGNRLSASRTQEPAEWQKKLTDMFGVWLAIHGAPEQIDSYNGYYERAIAPFLLRAASIPAPERSKGETGVRVADGGRSIALASWSAFYNLACEFGRDINAYADAVNEVLDHDATIRAALEPAPIHKGEAFGTAWQTSYTGDEWHFAREASFSPSDLERGIVKNVTTLSTLETPPLHKEGEAVFISRAFDPMTAGGFKPAAPAPVPVPVTPEEWLVDRQLLVEAARDESLADGTVRCLILAKKGDVTPEVEAWASVAALSVKPGEQG